MGRGASDSGRLACVSVRAPGPNDRLSVGDRPRSPAPYTVYASSVRHATSKGRPIERTVPSQVHPAAQRRPSPTALAPPSGGAHALLSPLQIAPVDCTHPRLTPAPPPWRDAAPSSPPAAASPSPGRLLAPPRAPGSATTRSAASAPGPRFPPSALAYSRS